MRLRELQISYKAVSGTRPGPRPRVLSARDAVAVVGPLLGGKIVEYVCVLSLDTRNGVIGWDVVSIGTVDAAIVHPREVFLTAILHHATALILVHNHPSGDPSPSADDIAMGKRLKRCGELLGIPVLDSIILTDEGSFVSLRELGALEGV